jgi:hypothetical protein
LKVEVKGVRGHCKNLHYSMRKRSGFPQLTDEGEADLRVWGHKGMLIKVVLKPEMIVEETITQTIETSKPYYHQSLEETRQVSEMPETTSTTQKLETARKLKLSVVKARCSIDELDLDLHGTHHSWFFTLLGPLVRSKVKSALEGSIERNLLALMD